MDTRKLEMLSMSLRRYAELIEETVQEARDEESEKESIAAQVEQNLKAFEAEKSLDAALGIGIKVSPMQGRMSILDSDGDVDPVLVYEGDRPDMLGNAFDIAIAKWTMIVDYAMMNEDALKDGDSGTCGLCMWSGYCRGCPIARDGHHGCMGTPWIMYGRAKSQEQRLKCALDELGYLWALKAKHAAELGLDLKEVIDGMDEADEAWGLGHKSILDSKTMDISLSALKVQAEKLIILAGDDQDLCGLSKFIHKLCEAGSSVQVRIGEKS